MSTRSRRLLTLVAIVVLALGAWRVMDSMVRQMLYPAPPWRVPSPPPAPLVEVPLQSDDRTVSAWYQPPRDSVVDEGNRTSARERAPLVLMFHGNGENLETMRQSGLFADLASTGAGILAIDYPGYGRSPGTPSEEANLAAAESAWDWLQTHAEDRPLVIAGWSLGAAVAAQLAARHHDEIAGAMLLSPWDRLDEVARLHFPGWMVGVLLSERYDSTSAAHDITVPTLVIHGQRDNIIPVQLGHRLFDALPGPKQWIEVPGAGHNDLLAQPQAWQAISSFLRERAKRSSPSSDL